MVADKKREKQVADMDSDMLADMEVTRWPTLRWTLWPTLISTLTSTSTWKSNLVRELVTGVG